MSVILALWQAEPGRLQVWAQEAELSKTVSKLKKGIKVWGLDSLYQQRKEGGGLRGREDGGREEGKERNVCQPLLGSWGKEA